MERYCNNCQKKTPHAKVSAIGSHTYRLVCDLCGKITMKKNPPQKNVILSEQYEGEIPSITDENRAVIRTTNNCSPSPHCKIHGALLRFEGDVWRCIECGFAIKWKRIKPPSD